MTQAVEAIKKFAELKGIKQAKLAEMSGFTEVSIYRWFAGQRQPTIANVEKLANVLGLSIEVSILEQESEE